MKRELVVLIAAAMGLTACSGGGGSSTAQNTNGDGEVLSALTTGYALPTEISAVPADNSSAAASLAHGLSSRLRALMSAVAVGDLPATSDYHKTVTSKFVEERSLEQFEIIEQVMDALQQTHYADQANINAGPYKVMVAWEDEENGVSIKRLEPWVVESRMIVIDGKDVNRLLAWIEENEDGQTSLIKAEFKVYKAATRNADGSFADYGEWDLNVKFNDSGSDFFAATARIVDGGTVLKINMNEQDEKMGQPITFAVKAVMHRSGSQGYGKVQYPDMNCDMNGCTPTTKTAQYAYNADYLALQEDGDPVVYKDRNGQTDFTRRYGLFYANADAAKGIAAGDALQKHKAFGFPVRYTDANGNTRHAYYGAWQGRHQLWADGDDLPAGTVVTREDRGPNETAETYTVSSSFAGTLTKRTLVGGDLSDILGIPVETFVNKHLNLMFDGTNWQRCDGWVDMSGTTPVCRDTSGTDIGFTTYTDFNALVMSQNDRKHVNIHRWDQTLNGGAGGMVEYVYLSGDAAGFYEATRDNMGRLTPQGTSPASFASGAMLNVNIGGSIYIQYTGQFGGPTTTTGWAQKTLQSFDQQTWTPSFVEGGDTAFTPEPGRDYYINNKGANFVVRRTNNNTTISAADYEVMIELQTAANPMNYSAVLPAGADYLRAPWRQELRYTLVTDAASANFLKLVHANDDPNTPDDETGIVLDSGEWGLRAYSDNGTPSNFSDDAPLMANGTAVTVDQFGIPTNPDQRPVEFNWEYSADGGWGTQQFLVDGSGNYKLLSDPIQLQPVTIAKLVNGVQVNKTLSLQFDGWMHGLPDLYHELSKNDWTMTQTIADKVTNIPEGTLVTDTEGVEYYVKPLEVSMFLTQVSQPSTGAPDITQAATVSLDSGMPTFVEHNMGALPGNTEVKYSEGQEVE